ncbi:MAG: response regulator [Clostridia bacterium]|nr:response regulator [Clostridia bacterium]
MKIFISYSHKNRSIVDEIDETFIKYGLSLVRDIRDLVYTQSIREFMKHNVQKSDYVLMLVSEHYLKSRMCMYEVMELLKDEYYTNRILPIVTIDSHIFEDEMIFEYYKYWKGKYLEYSKIIDAVDKVASMPFIEEFKEHENIVNNITRFLFDIRDRNCILINEKEKINLEKLLNKLGISTSNEKITPKKTILLVDDNIEYRNLLKIHLNNVFDYKIIDASNGLEALEIVASMDIDLVITDIIMPVLDGIGLLEEMKRINKKIPTIVVSAISQETFIERAVSLGAKYYIIKPFDVEKLIEKVSDFIDSGNEIL